MIKNRNEKKKIEFWNLYAQLLASFIAIQIDLVANEAEKNKKKTINKK